MGRIVYTGNDEDFEDWLQPRERCLVGAAASTQTMATWDGGASGRVAEPYAASTRGRARGYICVETGEFFPNAKEVYGHLGLGKSGGALAAACRSGGVWHGYRWRYAS